MSQPRRSQLRRAGSAVSTDSAVTVSPSRCASRMSSADDLDPSTVGSAPTPRGRAGHERPGQLQRVHGQVAQVGEVRVAGAEVVDGDPDAHARPARAARPAARRSCPSARSRSAPAAAAPRGQPGLGEDRGDVVDQARLAHLAGRQVDADEQPAAGSPRRHGGGLPAGLRSTQRPSGTMSPVSSASAMNRSGPSRRRTGASQRTSASTPDHRSVAQPHQRLVLHHELAAASASGIRADSAKRPTSRWWRSASNSAHRSRPSAFAQYSVVSAAFISSAASGADAVAAHDAGAGRDHDAVVRRARTGCAGRPPARVRASPAQRAARRRPLDEHDELVAAHPGHQVLAAELGARAGPPRPAAAGRRRRGRACR